MDKTQRKRSIQKDHSQRSDILHFLVKKYQICFNIVDSRMKKPAVSDFFIELSTVRMTNERLSEEYLSVFYDHLHRKIYDFDVIGADETPVEVNKDGRPAGSKSYIWVYRSGGINSTHHIVLYEYPKTRNASHPVRFLKDHPPSCQIQVVGISGNETDPSDPSGRREAKGSENRRKIKAASVGDQATGRCFVCIRKTASGSGRDTGKTCQSSDISVKSGKVSAGISRKWGSADG